MSMRIGGLVSGMDIDSLVAKLMTAERIPLDKLTQKKQILEWQRDDYRSMNTLLYDLKNFIGPIQTDGIGRQATFLKKIVTSSNDNAVIATNINATSDINTQITVSQLATAASMWSNGDIRVANSSFDTSKLLKDQAINFNENTTTPMPTSPFDLNFTYINNQGTTTTTKVTIDPNNDSLNSFISKINTTTDLNAFFDTQTGQLSIVAKNSGDVGGTTASDTANAEIQIASVDSNGENFLNILHLDYDKLNTPGTTSNIEAVTNGGHGNYGTNAVFTFNGMETFRTSNTFQINGFQYTLKQTTSTPVTIKSTIDTDSIYKSIKDFVDKYNDTIDKINSKISEKRYRSYLPLSDAQKKDMKDKDIELWEEKAKSGLLSNDSILSSGLNQMRLQIYQPVDGLTSTYYDSSKSKDITINQLANIGITTSPYYQDKGKLVIDESKLKEAIAQNPMGIYDLFNKEVENADGTLNYAQSGIVTRMEDVIGNTVENIETKAGKSYSTNSQFAIGKLLDQVNKDITSFEDRLKQVEDRYWRQFSAMEQAINQSNQQSAYLMQNFSTGQ
ncbi:flagellar hook-associated protein 2 [Tepidibacillus marianensis]|uniref:flagellar hook-associated protein 2 n=1 Tax=Tepidibacillus marianensis TaxID=3131995 RepID=UPI0030CFA15F